MAVERKTILASGEDSNVAFLFQLPEDGLALRSVSVVDGMPELTFEAAPKVPTLQEEDFATAFRLTSEDTRPGFAYVNFPPFHPLESRWFMQYTPGWLRWTGIGKLLADADWNMKCLHVGARTNEEKNVYKSWPKSSKLKGLRTRLNFPVDPDSSNPTIWMSCEEAEVQESQNKILFPTEPKMKIKDGTSLDYSEYITEVYRSVAYHDEPKFLKMQEVIKLILAVEWLWEKGIRVNKEWMLMHTSKSTDGIDNQLLLEKRRKPLHKMIPQPSSAFNRPPMDVAVKKREAEEMEILCREHGVMLWYGYYECRDAAMTVFSEKGIEILQQDCLRVSFQQNSSTIGGLYIPIHEKYKPSKFRDDILKALPECTKASSDSEPESVDTTVEDFTNKTTMKMKITKTYHSTPTSAPSPSETTVITATTRDGYDKVFSGMDPNKPIRPEIPGLCEAVIPNVESWEELISEFTVPRPSVWLYPFFGMPPPTISGGVSTRDFPVKKSPLLERELDRKTEMRDNYRRVGRTLTVRAYHVVAQGKIRWVEQQSLEFLEISQQFTLSWIKGTQPKVSFVFAITNQFLLQEWGSYKQILKLRGHSQEDEVYYHGTQLAHDIASSQALCNAGDCGICGISCAGMDPKCIRRNSFQRFGSGFYLAPHSSKCHDYNNNGRRYRAMLRCNVLPGQKYLLTSNSQNLMGPPPGCDSVYGVVGSELNYPEIVVYDKRAVMPAYIIGYQ